MISSSDSTSSACALAAGPVERCERRDVLQLVVTQKRPALEEPEFTVAEAELDVPWPRLPGLGIVHRREGRGDLLSGGDDLLQLVRREHGVAAASTGTMALPPPGSS